MRTQCPQCDTRFRVTEDQLRVAEGIVRCGICEHVFNAYDTNHLSAQDQPITEQPSQSDAHHETSLENTELTSNESSDEMDLPDDKNDHPDQLATELIDEQGISSTDVDERADQYEADNESKPASDEKLTDTYNFFEDKHDIETDYIVPREFHDSHLSNRTSTISTTLWSIGILLLTAALFVEYAWFNRNDIFHIPEVQAEIDTLCQKIDCTTLSLRAPSKIQLLSRNIYSHPNEDDALMVNVTIKNNATFSQPYPTMKIDFTDIRGKVIATRNFLPQEYLYAQNKPNDDIPDLLRPDASNDITIEIVDPGTQALTYEFNFL